MSTNRTLCVLALGLALAACSSGEKTQDAASVAPAVAPSAAPAAAPAAPTAAGTPAPAAVPAATSTPSTAAMAANTAAAPIDAAAQSSNVAPVATNAVIQSEDTNVAGFAADLIEAKRSDGVLSVKVRLKNTGDKEQTIKITYDHKLDEFYVQAESKKYFVLRDSEKVALAAGADGALYTGVEPGATYTWWAKYPAPPAEIKKFSFYWPLGAPFDDVPITDK